MMAKPTDNGKGKEPAPSHKPKCTRATARQRAEDVLRVRLDGAQFFQLREYVREREAAGEAPWAIPPGGKPLSDSQLWRYCQRADKLLAESIDTDRGALIREHVGKRRMIYARAINKGDERTALAAARDECELWGLYAPTRQEVSGPGGGPLLNVDVAVTMTPAERVAQVRRLIAAARARQGQAALPYYPNGISAANADGAGGTNDE
jgi:hypothetical protein